MVCCKNRCKSSYNCNLRRRQRKPTNICHYVSTFKELQRALTKPSSYPNICISKDDTINVTGNTTVLSGVTLTNNGMLTVSDTVTLVIEQGAHLTNQATLSNHSGGSANFPNDGIAVKGLLENRPGATINNGNSNRILANIVVYSENAGVFQNAGCINNYTLAEINGEWSNVDDGRCCRVSDDLGAETCASDICVQCKDPDDVDYCYNKGKDGIGVLFDDWDAVNRELLSCCIPFGSLAQDMTCFGKNQMPALGSEAQCVAERGHWCDIDKIKTRCPNIYASSDGKCQADIDGTLLACSPPNYTCPVNSSPSAAATAAAAAAAADTKAGELLKRSTDADAAAKTAATASTSATAASKTATAVAKADATSAAAAAAAAKTAAAKADADADAAAKATTAASDAVAAAEAASTASAAADAASAAAANAAQLSTTFAAAADTAYTAAVALSVLYPPPSSPPSSAVVVQATQVAKAADIIAPANADAAAAAVETAKTDADAATAAAAAAVTAKARAATASATSTASADASDVASGNSTAATAEAAASAVAAKAASDFATAAADAADAASTLAAMAEAAASAAEDAAEAAREEAAVKACECSTPTLPPPLPRA